MGELLPLADVYLIAMKHSKSLEYSTIHNKSVSKHVPTKCGWKSISVVDFPHYNFLGCAIYISYVNL